MYGWRGRIGIIVPSGNTGMEPEFNRLAAEIPGLAVYCARVHQKSSTVEGLLAMESLVVGTAAPDLARAGVHVIVYGCTSGSFSGGPGYDQRIVDQIQVKTGVPATTASTAAKEALRAVNGRRVALGTPYSKEVTARAKAFLESAGFEIVNLISLDNVGRIGDAGFEAAYELGRKLDCPEADCIFISCTKFPTLQVLDALETDVGKPVVTSNTASFWHALRILGVTSTVTGFGRLMECGNRQHT